MKSSTTEIIRVLLFFFLLHLFIVRRFFEAHENFFFYLIAIFDGYGETENDWDLVSGDFWQSFVGVFADDVMAVLANLPFHWNLDGFL